MFSGGLEELAVLSVLYLGIHIQRIHIYTKDTSGYPFQACMRISNCSGLLL